MVDLTIFENRFQENFGAYVLNLGLSHYNYLNTQKLEMRFNWVQRNVIKEPWLGLNPRSRVAAPVVMSSTNIKYEFIFLFIISYLLNIYYSSVSLDEEKISSCIALF